MVGEKRAECLEPGDVIAAGNWSGCRVESVEPITHRESAYRRGVWVGLRWPNGEVEYVEWWASERVEIER